MKAFGAILAALVLALCLSTNAFGLALVIEDVTAWNGSGISNTQTLTDIGVPWVKITSAELATHDLSPYQFVSYTSVQPMSYYANIKASLTKVSDYVNAGGILVAHSCIWGWNGDDTYWESGHYLPGGVGHNGADAPSQGYYSNAVSILDPAHPVINGPSGVVAEADLQNWNYSTHGYFTNLVAGTDWVIGVDVGGSMEPCYIEYDWGLGQVRATMMTLEWVPNDPGGTRHIFRENEYYYASQPIPEPTTLLLLGSGLLGLAGYGGVRRRRKR